jgi:hypothetical protein
MAFTKVLTILYIKKLICICFILNRSILFHFINQIYKVFAPPKILIFPFYNKIYRKFLHAIIFSVSFLLIYSKIVYHFFALSFQKKISCQGHKSTAYFQSWSCLMTQLHLTVLTIHYKAHFLDLFITYHPYSLSFIFFCNR